MVQASLYKSLRLWNQSITHVYWYFLNEMRIVSCSSPEVVAEKDPVHNWSKSGHINNVRNHC